SVEEAIDLAPEVVRPLLRAHSRVEEHGPVAPVVASDEERRGPWKRARVPRVSPPLAGVAHRPAERIPDVFRRAVGLVSRESGRPLEHRRDVLRREERAAVRTIECDGEANEID